MSFAACVCGCYYNWRLTIALLLFVSRLEVVMHFVSALTFEKKDKSVPKDEPIKTSCSLPEQQRHLYVNERDLNQV